MIIKINIQYREQLQQLNWSIKLCKVAPCYFDTEHLQANRANRNSNSGICGIFGSELRGCIEHLCVYVDCAEFELCVDEPEEFLVDNPAEVSWLAELLHGASVDGSLVLPSSYWAG